MCADFRLPRGLLVGQVASNERIAEEKRLLQAYFPQFSLRTDTDSGNTGMVRGTLKTFAGRSYAIRVDLPSHYPHQCPRVYPDGWEPRSNPHIFPDKRICIMRDEQWVSVMSAAFVVAKSALWLNKYEIYLDKHVWPGPEQHVHGPLYNLKKWWHDL